jgi:hypothetical protein
VRRKSPTSVWRRSMSSTRKAPRPPVTAYKWPGVAGAAAAAAAVAEVAGAAHAAVVAVVAAWAGEAAALRGAHAAGAEPIIRKRRLMQLSWPGPTRVDPAYVFLRVFLQVFLQVFLRVFLRVFLPFAAPWRDL